MNYNEIRIIFLPRTELGNQIGLETLVFLFSVSLFVCVPELGFFCLNLLAQLWVFCSRNKPASALSSLIRLCSTRK